MSLHDDPPLTPDLLLRERRWLVGFASALVGASDAEDLAQETLVLALERSDSTLRRGWLAGAAKNLAANRWRSGAARIRREREVARNEVRPELDASRLAGQAEAEQRVVEELLRLEEPYRETLLLRYQGGLSTPSLAHRLGVPAGTVRRRLSVGLGRLRERLDEQRGGRRAWAAALVRPVAAGSIGTTSLGLLAMNTKQLVGAALLLLILAGGGLLLFQARKTGSEPRGTAESVASGLREQGGGVDAVQDVPVVGLREALELMPGAGPQTRLAVLDAEAQPLVLERATLLGPESVFELDPEEPVTDQTGRFTLLVRPEGHWPFTAEVELGRGDVEARATDVGRIRGLVRVDGELPSEELWMEWTRDVEQQGFLHLDLAAAGWERQDFVVRTPVDSPEGVGVRGLPADWRGQLRAPEGHLFERSVLERIPVSLELDGSERQRFDLSRGFSIRLRFVDGESGGPVARVGAMMSLGRSSGNGYGFGVTSDDDGEVVHLGRSGSVTDLRIEGVFGEYALPTPLEFEFPEGKVRLDLGEIALVKLATASVWVLDEDGRPVEDATLRMNGNRASRGAAPGEWTVLHGTEQTELAIVAWSPRHAKASYATQLNDGPVTVRLRPGAALEVRAGDRDGQLRLGAGVLVLFDDLAGHDAADFVTEGAASWTKSMSGAQRIVLRIGKDGVGFVPGLPVGASGFVWEGEGYEPPESAVRFGPLAAGRTERVELSELTRGVSFARISGTVSDSLGNPLPNARVALRLAGEQAPLLGSSQADAGGRYQLQFESTARAVELVALAGESFGTAVDSFPDGLAGDLAWDLRLERGRLVRYRVEDSSGRPVRAEEVRCRRLPEERDWTYGRLSRCGSGASEGFVQGLGPGEIEFIARVGGVERRLLHRTDQPEARMVVPAAGSMSVTLTGLGNAGRATLVLRDPVRTERRLDRRVSRGPGAAFRIETVDPGIWEIALTDDFSPDDPGGEFEALAGPVRIEVFAGRTTEVLLEGR